MLPDPLYKNDLSVEVLQQYTFCMFLGGLFLFIYLLCAVFFLGECSLFPLRQPAPVMPTPCSVFVQCVQLDSLCFGLNPLTAMCRISGISSQLICLTFLIETLALTPILYTDNVTLSLLVWLLPLKGLIISVIL